MAQPSPAVETIDRELDLKGLNCPLPVLKTKLALKSMQPGEVLHAVTTDPMSVLDFRVFCMRSGHALLHWTEGETEYEFYIRRAASPAPKVDAATH